MRERNLQAVYVVLAGLFNNSEQWSIGDSNVYFFILKVIDLAATIMFQIILEYT